MPALMLWWYHRLLHHLSFQQPAQYRFVDNTWYRLEMSGIPDILRRSHCAVRNQTSRQLASETNSAAYLLDQLCSCILNGVFQLDCSGN